MPSEGLSLKLLQFIYRHTLNSVWFGISMMLLVGLYVAIGSGMVRGIRIGNAAKPGLPQGIAEVQRNSGVLKTGLSG